jgi:hypothetical protein
MTRPDADQRRAQLAVKFAGLDPITADGDIHLVREVVEYVADESVDDELRLLWARRAYQLVDRLCEPGDPDHLLVSDIYRLVLTSQGLTIDAIAVCGQRLRDVEAVGDQSQVQTTRHALARALHNDGQCGDAIRLIAGLAGDPCLPIPADTLVFSRAGMYAGCGMTATALRLLRRNAAAIAALSKEQLAHEAKLLAYIEVGHPAVGCERRRPAPQPADIDDRITFWRSQLDDLVHPATATTITPIHSPTAIAAASASPTDRALQGWTRPILLATMGVISFSFVAGLYAVPLFSADLWPQAMTPHEIARFWASALSAGVGACVFATLAVATAVAGCTGRRGGLTFATVLSGMHVAAAIIVLAAAELVEGDFTAFVPAAAYCVTPLSYLLCLRAWIHDRVPADSHLDPARRPPPMTRAGAR